MQRVVRIDMQRALANSQFSLRIRNLDLRVTKQPFDSIVDVTPNLHMQAWTISPHEQTKIQRPITELEELNLRWRIFQNVVNTFGRFQQSLSHQIDVGL